MTSPSKKKQEVGLITRPFFLYLTMEEMDIFLKEQLWRKDMAYKELAGDYFRLQLEYTELRQQYEMMLLRLDLGNDDEEYD